MILSNRAARAAADAVTALLDAGTGSARLKVYGGPVPADADTPIGDAPPMCAFEHCYKNQVGSSYERRSFGFLEYLDQPRANAPKWDALLDTVSGGVTPFGVNLSRVTDWLPQWPFIDAMKMARDWVPQDTDESPNGSWDTGETLTLDSDRWPILAAGKAAATILFADCDGRYPGGTYRVLWDGSGAPGNGTPPVVFDYQFNDYDVTSITYHGTGQGADLAVTPGSGAPTGIVVKINHSDPADPIRNVRIFMPGFDESSTETFHPDYLASLANLRVLRFMDWGATNDSYQVDWADRPQPTWATQTVSKLGVAVELMCQLMEATGKPGWFCIPHQATDLYVASWATTVAANLTPGSKIYLEYSNEFWNDAGGFTQGGWMQDQAVASGEWPGDPVYTQRVRWYSRRTVQIWAIARPILEAAGIQVCTVMGSSAVNSFTTRTALDFEGANLVTDFCAIAPYVGGTIGNADVSGQSVAQILALLTAELADKFSTDTVSFPDSVYRHKADCESRGVQLAFYELGQHLEALANQTWTAAVSQLFVEVNRDAGMKTFMAAYLAECTTALGSGTNPLLADVAMSDPAMQAAIDADPGAEALANAIAQAVASASGLATFYRATDSDGLVVWQGTTGTVDEDLVFDDAGLVQSAPLSGGSVSLFMPES